MTFKDKSYDVCVFCNKPIPKGTTVCPECDKAKPQPWQKPRNEKEMNALSEGLGRMVRVDFKRVFLNQHPNKGEKTGKSGDK